MILLPLLVISSGFLIMAAIHHLNQSLVTYYDFVALTMVLGGTLTLMAVLIPWEYRKDVKTALKLLFRPEKAQYRNLMNDVVTTLQTGKYNSQGKTKWLYQRILADGVELIQLGFSKERIEEILTERLFQSTRRWKRVAASFRNLAKYPPAFGLTGTVFGLVNIMKGLAANAEPGKLGTEMSIALVATMYGLLLANFVVNPIGELMGKKSEEEEEYGSVAVHAILLLKDQTPMLESIELLNSMVPDDQKQKFGELTESGEAA